MYYSSLSNVVQTVFKEDAGIPRAASISAGIILLVIGLVIIVTTADCFIDQASQPILAIQPRN